ncbi:MAG: sensor histidine kinase [Lachnospiraceae bacterium]|nr:sensor histidine kinase [Lachnospiraceae bacterium]
MRYLIEKIILFLLCLILLLPNFEITVCAAASLLILALSSLSYYSDNGRLSLVTACLTVIFVWYLSALGMYLPITAYDTTDRKLTKKEKLISYFCIIAAYAVLFPRIPFRLGCLLMLLILAAIVMGRSYHMFCQLQDTIRRNRDHDRELQLLLEQKNADLIEKSHYEIEAATLRERNRIAREIHDNVGHLLTRSILQIGAINTIHKNEQLTPFLDQVSQTLNQAMDTIRTSVHNLHNPETNLQFSINSFICGISQPKIHLHYKVEKISQTLTYHLLSIIKEAIHNTIRHSNADCMQITMLEHPQFYQLIIEDNGVLPEQFSPSGYNGSGMGLLSMQERILSLHGTIEITTEHGFRIFISVPKERL